MLLEVLGNIFSPASVGLIILGLAVGNFVGCMPGLTATMALAVLVPLTYYMPISLALTLMGAIYVGAIRGGGIAAILVNIPGTPSDIATTFDGYPMTQQGKAREALMMSIFASVMGGLIGNTFLILVANPLAKVALKFGPPELFWISILGIALMVSLSESLWKGLISGFLGLLITAVGVSPLGGESRFTFGLTELAGGVPIIAGLIGLYCIPRILELPQEATREETGIDTKQTLIIRGNIHKIMWETIKAWFSNLAGFVSALIGTVVGILPGAGGNIAGIMAYDQVKRFAKNPQNFGKGDIRGVASAESANNATVSSSLVPMLTFGVPGSPPAAVLLGAILVQGLRPGPELFTKYAVDTYTFIGGLFLANILLLPVGMYLSNMFSRIMFVSKEMLAAAIGVLSVVGTLAIRGNVGDVFVMIILGLLMYIGGRLKFSPAPAVLGIVLGRIAEEGLTQSMMISKGTGGLIPYFLGRPITVALIIFTLFTILWPYLQKMIIKRRKMKYEGIQEETCKYEPEKIIIGNEFKISELLADKIISVLLIVICGFIFWKTSSFSRYGAIFPIMTTSGVLLFSILYFINSWIPYFVKKRQPSEQCEIIMHAPSLFIGIGSILLYVYLLMPTIGFLTSTFIYMLGLILGTRVQRRTLVGKGVLYSIVFSAILSFSIYYTFANILNIHLPTGIFI
ncbi:MAG: tripartite tricarboxylate transporter permease [Desulfovermiculus sp.]|nr:tripartite tricarboxylate transporter permease [Desulfovermiculus sp.]